MLAEDDSRGPEAGAVQKGTQKRKGTHRELIRAIRASRRLAFRLRKAAFVLAAGAGTCISTPTTTADEGIRFFSDARPPVVCRARFDHFSGVESVRTVTNRTKRAAGQSSRANSVPSANGAVRQLSLAAGVLLAPTPAAAASIMAITASRATSASVVPSAAAIASSGGDVVHQTSNSTPRVLGNTTVSKSRTPVTSHIGIELRPLVEPDNLARVRLPLDDDEVRNLSDWGDLVVFPVSYDHRPSYLPDPGYTPAIDPSPRPPSATGRPFRELLDNEIHRQVRRLVKSRWRDQFKSDFSMTHAFYRSRVAQINQIGRRDGDFDPFNVDQFHNETRNDALNRPGLEGERELMLVEWGGMQLDDHGSFSFNPRSFFDLDSEGSSFFDGPKFSTEIVKRDPTDQDDVALFKGKFYRLRTKLRLNFNPFRAVRNGAYQDTISSYGGAVEVDFLSDILKRKLFTTEFEGELKQDGRWGVFFNLVFRARR